MANVLESNSPEASDVTLDKQNLARLQAEQARKVQALKLNRARIREQLARTTNERYTTLLNSELEHIEADLAKLA